MGLGHMPLLLLVCRVCHNRGGEGGEDGVCDCIQ